MASLMANTPLQKASGSRLDRQLPRSGPAQGSAPASCLGAGRAEAKRAQVTAPSKVTTTTQRPVESRAVTSDVRSRRPVNSRPPTKPTAGSTDMPPCSLWAPEPTLGAGPRYPPRSHGPLARAGRSPSRAGRGRSINTQTEPQPTAAAAASQEALASARPDLDEHLR